MQAEGPRYNAGCPILIALLAIRVGSACHNPVIQSRNPVVQSKAKDPDEPKPFQPQTKKLNQPSARADSQYSTAP